jgi:hypothetical protein
MLYSHMKTPGAVPLLFRNQTQEIEMEPLHSPSLLNQNDFFCNLAFFRNNFTFRPLNNLMSFLDPLFGVMSHDAEVIRLRAIAYGAEDK